MLLRTIFLLLVLLFPLANNCLVLQASAKKNILFIAIDDLNDMVPILDQGAIVKTPNIDKLASKSTVFTNAFASSTLCNPSRFSLLTGLKPSTTGVYLNISNSLLLEDEYLNIMTYLRQHDYQTIGVGKIFHGTQNQESAWDIYHGYHKNRFATRKSHNKWPVNWGVVNDKFLDQRDELVTDKALEYISKKFEQPTFLAVGFHNPHLPWFYTKEIYDKHAIPLSKIHKPEEPEYILSDLPKSARTLAIQYNIFDQSNYHEKVIDAHEWKRAIQAYLVGVAYMDEKLGELLEAFYASPNFEDTIVVLWSDHGYHLGEKKHWNKHGLWEKTTHILLMFSFPQRQKIVNNSVVSLLDVFPTIIDFLGLPKLDQLEGNSLMPIMFASNADWDNHALTTMDYKNHSVRGIRWRYTRYKDGSEELYDKKFDQREFYNLAENKSLKQVKKRLKKFLPEDNHKPIPEEVFVH
ncbi:MAG: sulfatase [Candidatus Caenarcaniphilales bacterium]|nr:sulfatase [Candidatus Caenarcaniphilales bacterium]